MGTILAIDPGNIKSGYVVVEHDGEEIRRVLEAGKIENPAVTDMLDRKLYANCMDVAIEMIAGMGMPCGLPKGGNACQHAKLAPDFCERCGWNPEEQARRKALPFKKSEDGLLHKDISTKE